MKSKLRRQTLAVALLLVILISVVSTAWAGKWALGSITFRIGSLEAEGDLRGTGNTDYAAVLTGYARVTALCQNKGGNTAPGRNPITARVIQTGWFTTQKNGRSFFDITAENPTIAQLSPSPTPKQAGCPNGNWKVVGVDGSSVVWQYASIVGYEAARFDFNKGVPMPGAQPLFAYNFACSYGVPGDNSTFGCSQVGFTVPPAGW